jgi:GNAT superfamily N-acetyltransferase
VLVVRAVRATDAASLRSLRLQGLTDAQDAFASSAEREADLPESHWSELARQSELADAMVIYAAIDGERWLGMAAARWHDRPRGIAHLWGMWVDPALRRLGIGERLVRDVRAWAAGRGARFLRLGVVIGGPADPTAFYERLGFVRTGETGTLRRDPARPVHYLTRPI